MPSSMLRLVTRAWPSALLWIHPTKVPPEIGKRRLEEFLAWVAMLQINEKRQRDRLSLYAFGVITDNLHVSASDAHPHVTIAAATEEMRAQGKHIVIHSRTDTKDHDIAKFAGAKEYPNNIKDTPAEIRQSYLAPFHVHNVLQADTTGAWPVAYFRDSADNADKWFFLNNSNQISYIPQFFSFSSGGSEYLAFFNAKLQRFCRAVFFDQQRPGASFPAPESTNLAPLGGVPEEIQLHIKWGRDMKNLIRFTSADGKKRRSSWRDWRLVG
ncbi:unnamed protein product [Clonostachys solani]|uniref:Uncharacterized protein n=1 Tax=Clonostachys solani TaxID=160281 RepID=A0A9N9W4K9_9HYPO|nr:unnamed protein product [Clonostachys solani]